MTDKKCPYKDLFTYIKGKVNGVFGLPNEGIHSHRIFDIAYIDVIATFIGAFLIQRLCFPKVKYLKVLLYLFLLGIVLHRIFGVRTTIDKLLFY